MVHNGRCNSTLKRSQCAFDWMVSKERITWYDGQPIIIKLEVKMYAKCRMSCTCSTFRAFFRQLSSVQLFCNAVSMLAASYKCLYRPFDHFSELSHSFANYPRDFHKVSARYSAVKNTNLHSIKIIQDPERWVAIALSCDPLAGEMNFPEENVPIMEKRFCISLIGMTY